MRVGLVGGGIGTGSRGRGRSGERLARDLAHVRLALQRLPRVKEGGGRGEERGGGGRREMGPGAA